MHVGVQAVETNNHIKLLLEVTPVELQSDVQEYVKELIRTDSGWGIDESFLGFLDDYVAIAGIINRLVAPVNAAAIPGFRNPTVVDVGCALALQHMFFHENVRYIGIDEHPVAPKFFRKNCTYVAGRFSDVVGTLDLPPYAFGVANMSILYNSHDVAAKELSVFDSTFICKYVR